MGEERPSPTRSGHPGTIPHSNLVGWGARVGGSRGLDVRASGLLGSHSLGQPLFRKFLYNGLGAADSCFSSPSPPLTAEKRKERWYTGWGWGGGRGGDVVLLGASEAA